MATATVTVTVDNYPAGVDNSQRLQHIRGTLAVQASPATYATGGLPVSFLGAQDSGGNFLESLSGVPVEVVLISLNGNLYSYNAVNNKLKYFTAPGTEETNGTAIPAGVSGDTIQFIATFKRNF